MINVKTANYLDVDEVEKIINDHWYNMTCTNSIESCQEAVFLDLSDSHIYFLTDQYQYAMNKIADIQNNNYDGNSYDIVLYSDCARDIKNELTLINALRKDYYTGTMLILIMEA